jgi:hypothetical protein
VPAVLRVICIRPGCDTSQGSAAVAASMVTATVRHGRSLRRISQVASGTCCSDARRNTAEQFHSRAGRLLSALGRRGRDHTGL